MKFSLTKNKFYKKEGDPRYVACTRVHKRLTQKHVIERLSYSSTLTEADINAVLSGLEKVLVDFMVMGYSIDLGFISLGVTVKGGFESAADNYRKDRNWIEVHAKVNKSVRNAVNGAAKPEKVFSEGTAPYVQDLVKISGDLNSLGLTGGNLVRISGRFLGFDEKDLECGVFLKSETGSDKRVSEYAMIGNTKIIFKFPDNTNPGNYGIVVRTRARSGKILLGVFRKTVDAI